jgi:hypothetical protein
MSGRRLTQLRPQWTASPDSIGANETGSIYPYLVLLTALVVKAVWWVVQPMIPYVIVGLGLVWIIGFVLYRRTRW